MKHASYTPLAVEKHKGTTDPAARESVMADLRNEAEVNYVAERKAEYEHEWARKFEEKAKKAGVEEYKAKVRALG